MNNTKNLETALSGLLKGLSERHLKELNASLGETLKSNIQRSFEKERSPDGAPWRARKDGYDKSRKILYESGNLSGQWASESSATHFAAFNPAKSREGFAYGLAHQFGSAKNKLPARPFLPLNKDNSDLSDAIKNELLAEVAEYFAQAVKNIK